MYKLITSARDTDELSIDFDRDRGRRQPELSKNKNQKVNFILEVCLKIYLVLLNTENWAWFKVDVNKKH